MKKLNCISLIICAVFCFSACNAPENKSTANAGGKSDESPALSAASVPDSILDVPQSSEFVNKDMLNLAVKTNADIKALFSGESCAYVASMGAACLEYYSPFISFLLAATSVPGGGASNKFAENPFADNTEVLQFSLYAEYDAAEHKVSSQDSLRLLFNANEEITYELLSQKLKQSPELQRVSEAYYAPIVPFAPGQNNTEALTPIDGGLYEADYVIDEIPVRISYNKTDKAYTAFGVTAGKADFSKLSGK